MIISDSKSNNIVKRLSLLLPFLFRFREIHGTDMPDFSRDKPELLSWVMDVAITIVKKSFSLANEKQSNLLPGLRENASVLVFLPGKSDVDEFARRLVEAGATANKSVVNSFYFQFSTFV